MKIKCKIVYGELPGELEKALEKFINQVGWGNVADISYSQGDMRACSRYSALVIYHSAV